MLVLAVSNWWYETFELSIPDLAFGVDSSNDCSDSMFCEFLSSMGFYHSLWKLLNTKKLFCFFVGYFSRIIWAALQLFDRTLVLYFGLCLYPSGFMVHFNISWYP